MAGGCPSSSGGGGDRLMAQSRKARLQPKPVADFGHPVTEDEIDRPGAGAGADLRSAPGPPGEPALGGTATADPAQDDQVLVSRPPTARADEVTVSRPSPLPVGPAVVDVVGDAAAAE